MIMEYKDFVVRFIKHLDDICKQEGTTVANKYHINKVCISNIRTGKRVPRPEFFEKHFGHKIMIFVEEEKECIDDTAKHVIRLEKKERKGE